MGNQGFFVDLFSLWCLRVGFKENFLRHFLETLAGSEDGGCCCQAGCVCLVGICRSGKPGAGGGGGCQQLEPGRFPPPA